MTTSDFQHDIPRLTGDAVLLAPLAERDRRELEGQLPESSRRLLQSENDAQPMSPASFFVQAGIQSLPPWGIYNRHSARLSGICRFAAWHLQHRRAELAFAADGSPRSEGLLLEALRLAIRFGFTTLEINRIESFCLAGNPATSGAAQGAGMTREALLRGYVRDDDHSGNRPAWHDVQLFAILRSQWSG
ncbi:MAG: GNAT family N-acetyltransferase [Bacteroidetes bacterium]|nr:GNAT family N-acetyltransferase [Bacteroidota bacterium]